MTAGDEALVVRDFATWLTEQGWTVRTEADYADVLAERDGKQLVAEAKGRTDDPGTDSDIAWGQLLRRMPAVEDTTRYVLVIRDEPRSVRAATRVPARIRELLRVTLYAVANDGTVREIKT